MMDDLIQRLADSALSIVILASWLAAERRDKAAVSDHMWDCLKALKTPLDDD